MFSQRIKHILDFLLSNQNGLTLKELISCLKDIGIERSERTIRNDIEELDFNLKKLSFLGLDKKFGGLIKIKDHQAVLVFFSERFQIYNLSTEERQEYILAKALLDNSINLTDLVDELDISRATITRDFKVIKQENELMGIKFVSSHKIGYTLEYSEESMRMIMLRLYLKHVNNKNGFLFKYLNSNMQLSYDRDINIFLNNIKTKLNLVIADKPFEALRIYINFMIVRLLKNKVILRIQNENFLRKTTEGKYIIEEMKFLEKKYELKIPPEESLKLTDLILGCNIFSGKNIHIENWINIELPVIKLIKEFSEFIKIDLTHDKELLDGIINHLKPTLYRMKYKIRLENSVYDEIIESYKELYEITKLAINNIFIEDMNELNNDEIAILATYFKLAIDRNKVEERKRILIICNFGYGSSKLLEHQLKDLYNIEIIDIIPKNQLNNYNKMDQVDLIISTTDLDGLANMVKVNIILKEIDKLKLQKLGLSTLKKKYKLENIIDDLSKYCVITDKDKFENEILDKFSDKIIIDDKDKLINLSSITLDGISLGAKIDTWEEAIIESGRLLINQGLVNRSYVKEMIESIQLNGTYMCIWDGILIPHGNVVNVQKTGAGILVLSEPIEFPGGVMIDVIVPFASSNGENHKNILSDLMHLIASWSFSDIIRKVKSPHEILEYIIEKREL